METILKNLIQSIKQDFIFSIEKWADIMCELYDIKRPFAYEYAIEEILDLSNDSFFDELSNNVFEPLLPYFEENEKQLRNEFEKILKQVADDEYNYGFAFFRKYYS